jgi:hypothetical protein
MFTVQDRDRVRDRILAMARSDARVVAGAIVGSLAMGGGDRWSDLDLTFGVAPGASTAEVLHDWTGVLERECGATQLFDLPYRSSIYRVFVFPGHLQVDLSFTPAADFGALSPRFELIFGEAVPREHIPVPSGWNLFGVGVHHAIRARVCIERGRPWEAEYWVSAVRDHALSLACRARGLEPRHARGVDQLPDEVTAPLREALARSLERDELLRALAVAIDGLVRESRDLGAPAASLEPRLLELARPSGSFEGP